MQTKLTLRLDAELIRRAKAHAEREGQSVSELVAGYFARLTQPPSPDAAGAIQSAAPAAPITTRLLGALQGSVLDEQDYRQHLQQKHG